MPIWNCRPNQCEWCQSRQYSTECPLGERALPPPIDSEFPFGHRHFRQFPIFRSKFYRIFRSANNRQWRKAFGRPMPNCWPQGVGEYMQKCRPSFRAANPFKFPKFIYSPIHRLTFSILLDYQTFKIRIFCNFLKIILNEFWLKNLRID